MKLKAHLEKLNDPRGLQGQDYRLWSILALILVGYLCGRRSLMAVFRMGRSLTARQRSLLGFVKGKTPCHATLTETVRMLVQRDWPTVRQICRVRRVIQRNKEGDMAAAIGRNRLSHHQLV